MAIKANESHQVHPMHTHADDEMWAEGESRGGGGKPAAFCVAFCLCVLQFQSALSTALHAAPLFLSPHEILKI